MSDVDRIYQKYMAVFYEVDGTWIGLDAVRYALRAALRELVQGDSAELSSLRELVASLRCELAAAIDERNAADVECADAERDAAGLRQQLIALDADNALLTAELHTRRQMAKDLEFDNARLTQELATLRSWVTAPTGNSHGVTDDFGTVITAPGKTRTAPEMLAAVDTPGLSWPDDLADWVEGLEKGRHDWRKLAKSVRWQLLANVVNQVKDSVQFDEHRPQWMSTSRAAAATFGDGKWETVVARARAGEVVR